MKFRNIVTGVTTSLMLATGAAHAASLNIVDAGVVGGLTSGVIPGGTRINDLLEPLFGVGTTSLDGFFGSAIQLVGSGKITADFYGWEAGFDNDFNLGGSELFSTNGSPHKVTTPFGTPLGSFTTALLAGGLGTLVDFSFDVNSDNHTITNGDENTSPIRGFFASVHGDATSTKGTSIWLFLDDGGAGPDDNHDDMAILLTVTPVPVPAAGFLLIAGLGGLAALKRRKKA